MNLTDNLTSTNSFRSITDKAALIRGSYETIVTPILSHLKTSQQHYKVLRSHSRLHLLLKIPKSLQLLNHALLERI